MLFEKLHERYYSFLIKKLDEIREMIEYSKTMEECINNKEQFSKEIEKFLEVLTEDEKRKWIELSNELELKIALVFGIETRLPNIKDNMDLENVVLFREMLTMIYDYITDALLILDELNNIIKKKKPMIIIDEIVKNIDEKKE